MPCPAFPRDRRRTLNSSSSPVFLLPMAFSPLFLSRAERSRAMAERNLPRSVASEGRTPQGFISVQMPSVLARLSPGPPSTAELRSRAQHLQHPSPLPRLVWFWETFLKLSTSIPGHPPPRSRLWPLQTARQGDPASCSLPSRCFSCTRSPREPLPAERGALSQKIM